MLFPSLVFSKFLCPTKVSESVVLVLGSTEVFIQHFIILGLVLGLAVVRQSVSKMVIACA